jgi:NADH-quinone oxidoreductase subunit L
VNLEFLPWIILLLPLVSAAAITLLTQKSRELSARLSIGAILTSFALSVIFILVNGWAPPVKETIVPWLEVGDLQVDFGLRLDPLSSLMLLIVTGVGGAIHIYSLGYLHDDRGYSRYFAGLSLFTLSMLGIVLSNNFLMLFIFWELVGVSSYLLIGHWFERPAAADASKKAFLTNRIGDFGFMLGILSVWALAGGLNFSLIEDRLKTDPGLFGSMATIVGLLIFCGAMGKSAQFPLHVWLPDAMEGPTPVSALIHAATMVAAGVYMLCRVFFILNVPGSYALEVIGWIGGITSLLAALMAVQQNDIKRILAYSTLSQLGYMVMAVGCRGPTPAMYHLTTHAFFKALLFLGAGAVIHSLHHEQNIWRMGGLNKKMPVTFWTFFLATLALCGVPPFSGFYSKDEVLAVAYEHNISLFVLGITVAVLTTFYMFRLVFVVFLGPAKSAEAGQAHEAPGIMTWPLRILAVPTVLGGIWGIGQIYGGQLGGERVEAASWIQAALAPFGHSPAAAVFGLLAVIFGFVLAFTLYANATAEPLPEKIGALARAMRNRFYFDELYEATVVKLQETVAAVAGWIDQWIIAGLLVRGTHGTTELIGRALRLTQTGNLQTYAFLSVLGVAVVLYLVLGR